MALVAALALASAKAAAGPAVGMTLRRAGPGEYDVDASFESKAPRAVAWAVLTDYERIPRFVPSLRESRVKERGQRVLLEQKSVGRVLFFRHTVHVLLAVHELPPDRIEFRDTLGTCFRSYEGSWSLDDSGRGTRVRYSLSVIEGPNLPAFVPEGAVAKGIREMLRDVAAEMDRQAEKPAVRK